MGLFDRFKKKKQDDAPCESILDTSVKEEAPAKEEAAPAAPAPAAEQKPETIDMLAEIAERFPQAERQGNALVFPSGLELRITLAKTDVYPKGVCIQFLFVMWHPFFDEDLVESVAGMGRTKADAVRDGIKGFCDGVLPFVLGALDCTGEHTLRTELQGNEYIFHEPCVIGGLHRGTGEGADLWGLVRELIPQYLGTKKAYWIKLLSSRMGKDICEARINGMVFPELTDVLYKAIADGKSTADGTMDKCFVLLLQDDATCKPCPFTKADAAAVAQQAIAGMLTIEDEESHRAVYEKIQQLHPTLGGEACAFVPEIYCRIIYNYHTTDSLLPVSLNIGEVRKSQVRSFGYFESAVLDYLRKERPKSDDHVKILRLSAEFGAINQAVQGGSKIEDLRFSPLAYVTPEDYVIW